jgi:hypothetical protein
MKFRNIRYLSPKDVQYTLDGKNLYELRKVELRNKLAVPLGIEINPQTSHNDMLMAVILKLDALEAPNELNELSALRKKEAPKKKKKK